LLLVVPFCTFGIIGCKEDASITDAPKEPGLPLSAKVGSDCTIMINGFMRFHGTLLTVMKDWIVIKGKHESSILEKEEPLLEYWIPRRLILLVEFKPHPNLDLNFNIVSP